jgi:tetratricopeptide (TPR) repeat protein
VKKNKNIQDTQKLEPISFIERKAVYLSIAVILLLTFAVRIVLMLQVKSVTYDESSYLSSGEQLAKELSWDSKQLIRHPPLSFLTHGYVLNKYIFTKTEDRLFWARFIMMFFSVLLAIYLFRFTKQLYGIKPAVLALLLYTFCPDILAHSGLITTDVIVACFIFMTVYYFLKHLNNGKTSDLLLTGLSFGLALLSKYTAVLLVIIIPVIVIIGKYFYQKKVKLYSLLVILVIGIFLLNLGYNFAGTFTPVSKYKLSLQSKLFKTAQKLLGPVPMLLPQPYILGFDEQQYIDEIGHPSFLFGQRYYHGKWYYFPTGFFIKTPLPMVLLIFFSMVIWFSRRKKPDLNESSVLVTVFVILFFICFLNHNNAGYRYIIPVLPFLYLFTAQIINERRKTLVYPIYLMIGWYVITSIAAHPHYLEYFSELIGGPKNGYKYMLDSNLDWGQNQASVLKYMDSDQTLKFNPGQIPTTGHVIVNANNLQDVFRLRTKYDWLRKFKPISNVEYAWLVYDIKPSDFEQFVKDNPVDASNHYNLAYIYYSQGKISDSIKELNEAIKLDPNYSYAYNMLGKIYFNRGDKNNGIKCFNEAMRSDSLFSEPYKNLSIIYNSLGNKTESERLYKLAILSEILDSYVIKPASTSAQYYADLIVKYPDNPKLHNNLGVMLYYEGDINKSIAEIKTAINLDPYQGDYYANLAYVLAQKGDFVAALDNITKYEHAEVKVGMKIAYTIWYGEDILRFDSSILVLPVLSSQEIQRKLQK